MTLNTPDRSDAILRRELVLGINGASSQDQREKFGLSHSQWASLAASRRVQNGTTTTVAGHNVPSASSKRATATATTHTLSVSSTLEEELRRLAIVSHQSPVRVMKSAAPLSRRGEGRSPAGSPSPKPSTMTLSPVTAKEAEKDPPPSYDLQYDGKITATETVLREQQQHTYTTYKTSTEVLTISSSGTVLRMPSTGPDAASSASSNDVKHANTIVAGTTSESTRTTGPATAGPTASGRLVDQDPNSPFAIKAAWARFCSRAETDFTEQELCLVSCDTLRLLMNEYNIHAPEEVAQIEAQWALIQVEMNTAAAPPPAAAAAANASAPESASKRSPSQQGRLRFSSSSPRSPQHQPSRERSHSAGADMDLRSSPARPHLSRRQRIGSGSTAVLCDPNTCVNRDSSSVKGASPKGYSQRHEDHLLGAFLVRSCLPATPPGVRCNIDWIEPQRRASPEGIRTAYVERRDITRSLAYRGAVVGQPQQEQSPSNRRVFYDTAASQGPPLYLTAQPSRGSRGPSRRFSNKKNASSLFL
jgi:hypothetical protein